MSGSNTTRVCLLAAALTSSFGCWHAQAQCIDRWTQIEAGPPARQGSAFVASEDAGGIVMFGGYDQQTCSIVYLNDTWIWREQGGWERITTTLTPSPREGMAAAYDSDRDKVVMFGGDHSSPLSETWEFGNNEWTLRSVPGPSARTLMSMAYDSQRKVCVLFGGSNSSAAGLADTWEWDGNTWTARSVAGPSGRRGAAMAYDESRARTVLFGGWTTFGVPFADTWEWDGSAWTQIQGNGPPASAYAGMCYDAKYERILLFGGAGASADHAETWVRKGTTWSRLQIPGSPAARNYASLAYDRISDRTVMFGGEVRNGVCRAPFGDTALLSNRPVVSLPSIHLSACPTGTANVVVNALSSGVLAYQWQYEAASNTWSNATNGPIPYSHGSITASNVETDHLQLTLNTTHGAPPIRFRCIVTNSCGSAMSEPATLAPCQADFTCDGQVDDADFVGFAAAYNILDCADATMPASCPADLNGDGLVDDSDFVLFVHAYNELGCL